MKGGATVVEKDNTNFPMLPIGVLAPAPTPLPKKITQIVGHLKSFFVCVCVSDHITPSGRKLTGSKEREKTLLIVATMFCLKRPRAAHALCSNQ